MTSQWVGYVIRASLYIAMITMTSQAASSGFHGNDFLLLFPDLGWSMADRPKPVVTVNTRKNPDNNLVSAEAFNANSELLHSYNFSSGSPQDLEFNSSYYLTPGLVESKAIRLTASGRVTCRVDSGTHQPYLSLPSQWLGTEYYVSTPRATSSSQKIVSVLAFAALFADTNISLTLTGNFTNVSLPESVIKEANNFNFILGEKETLQVHSEDETLSGAVIQSSQPVGVVSGAVMTSSVMGSGEGRVVAPLLPTSVWGRKFVVVLPALQGAHVYVDIVGVANCSVTVSNSTNQQEFDLDVSGQAGYDVLCDVTCPAVHMTSTSPVSMTYYVFPANDVTNATMTHVTPAERYNNFYKVRTSPSDTTGLQAVIVAPAGLGQGGFMIHAGSDLKKLTMGAGNGADWKPLNDEGKEEVDSVIWKSIGNPMFKFTRIKLKKADKLYRFEHKSGKRASFGLFVYRLSDVAMLDVPMEMRLVKLYGACSETTAKPGDGIDNDCDGRVDEELRDGKDNDNDNEKDEDNTDEDPVPNPPPGHVTMAGAITGALNTQATQTLTVTSESDGNSTNTTAPTKTPVTPTTVKPTKLPVVLSKTVIICASVLLGLPLLIVLGVAVQACVMSNKTQSGGWDRMTRPEVVPIETLSLTPTAADCHHMEGETSC